LYLAGAVEKNAATFVTKDANGRLNLNGKPFRFSGSNMYWLGLDENMPASAPSSDNSVEVGATTYPTDFRINDAMLTMNEMGTIGDKNRTCFNLLVGCRSKQHFPKSVSFFAWAFYL
jgi:hypothetical protein